MYVHAVRPSAVGIPIDPFFGLMSNLSRTSKVYTTATVVEMTPIKDGDVADHEKQVQSFHANGTVANPSFDPSEAIRVVHLQKRFGKNKAAVDDMTISFKYGETFGLLGPNGAGKTTALSMITGLLRRSSGDIVIGGEPPFPK